MLSVLRDCVYILSSSSIYMTKSRRDSEGSTTEIWKENKENKFTLAYWSVVIMHIKMPFVWKFGLHRAFCVLVVGQFASQTSFWRTNIRESTYIGIHAWDGESDWERNQRLGGKKKFSAWGKTWKPEMQVNFVNWKKSIRLYRQFILFFGKIARKFFWRIWLQTSWRSSTVSRNFILKVLYFIRPRSPWEWGAAKSLEWIRVGNSDHLSSPTARIKI